MSNLFYDPRPCGAGKTYQEISEIIGNPGRYLYAVEKRTRMAEFEAEIQRRAHQEGADIVVLRIFSKGAIPEIMPDGSLRSVGSSNVRKDIEDLPFKYPNPERHLVVLVTHEALKMSDLSGFQRWHLTIDETPSIWDKQALVCSTAHTRRFLAENYDLVAITPTRCMIVPKGDQRMLTVKEIARDDMLRSASVLHQRVLSSRITVSTDLTSWSQLDQENATFEWASIWSPEQLPAFDRVHVLANAFDHSVTYQLFRRKWSELEWQDLNRPTITAYVRREVALFFYARAHEARRGFWDTERGQRYLRLAALDVAGRVGSADNIWMCNGNDERTLTHPDPEEGYLLPGHKLSPRQAGSNKYASFNNVTMLYTSKPTASERAVMNEIGLDPQFLIDSREREVMVQFATRSSVRVANSAKAVSIYVYDSEQAEYLAAYFRRTGYCDVSVELRDLGFADYVHDSTPGRKKATATSGEQHAKAEKVKEQARLRQQRCRAKKAALRAE